MSDDNVAADERQPKTRPPKLVLGLLAANLGVSAFILVKVMGGQAHATPHEPPPPHDAVRKEVVGPLVALDPFVVNLDESGTPRYLKVQLQVEMKDGGAVKALERNKTLVRDRLLGYFSGLKLSETLGADNKDQIRGELESQVAEIVGEGRVRRIVFADFVVQ